MKEKVKIKYSNIYFVVLGFILTIFIGIIDYFTGYELGLSLFYLIPICIVTWKIGKISGGLMSVKAEIKNIGESDFTDVSWTILVNGGIFDMIDRYSDGTISLLSGGNKKTVRALPILGLGKIEIEVTVTMPGLNVIKKGSEGLVLGPLVIVSS